MSSRRTLELPARLPGAGDPTGVQICPHIPSTDGTHRNPGCSTWEWFILTQERIQDTSTRGPSTLPVPTTETKGQNPGWAPAFLSLCPELGLLCPLVFQCKSFYLVYVHKGFCFTALSAPSRSTLTHPKAHHGFWDRLRGSQGFKDLALPKPCVRPSHPS